MKKFFLILIFFVALTVLFSKQILGIGARLALKWQCHCELAYHSVDWDEGALVFSDVVLFDPTFHVHVQKASVRFDWSALPRQLKGHLTLKGPHVSILKWRAPSKPQSSWVDFTVSATEGTADWNGLARFSAEHTPSLSQLFLEWDDASLALTLKNGQLDAELNEVKAALLKPWVPFGEIAEGRLTGRVIADTGGTLHSAHLKMADVGIHLPLASIKEIQGSVSYKEELGAKWELQAVGLAQDKQFPLRWDGRWFFKTEWVESNVQFGSASCHISRKEDWKITCERLSAEHATLIQAGASFLVPGLNVWQLTAGTFSGNATLSDVAWNVQFLGEDLAFAKEHASFLCQKAEGNLSQEGGGITLKGENYEVRVAGMWDSWDAEATLAALEVSLHGGWEGEAFSIQIKKGTLDDFAFLGRGSIKPNLDLCFSLEGNWAVLGREIPFFCPYFTKTGKDWAFDFRFERKTWDLFRLIGTSDGKQISFDEKSHFLGSPLEFTTSSLGQLDAAIHLPWEAILAAGPWLKEWGLDLATVPALHDLDLQLRYGAGRSAIAVRGTEPVFALYAEQFQGEWNVDLQSDLALQCTLSKEGAIKGKGSWKTGMAAEFEGKITPSFHCDLSLRNAQFDLAQIGDLKMEGKLEGQGHLVYNGQIEADFDFSASSLNIGSYLLENEGAIHLSYSSSKGAILSGLSLHGQFDCVVDLLEYDAHRSHWIFHNAQVHLPGAFLTHRFLQFLDRDRDLDFIADLDLASDFSTFVCTVSEGVIPFNKASHPIEDLRVCWKHGECQASLRYQNHLHQLQMHMDEHISGRLILGEEETPLKIDWDYRDLLLIQSIEGSFGGIEASFHAESPNVLIGSAWVDFSTLSQLIPKDVAEVFETIKMGKGYELKGRLKIEKNLPYFQGILSGKQLELFGFQFRTLLAQVQLGAEKVRIYDVKISDSAGMMKIDEILLQTQNEQPWTIDIPVLTIQNLRPSLLQRPGKAVGPISPLVVRELKLTHLTGLLDESKTYTAQGTLRFINSYKREETVFDAPANVLSRIVGLDLELLIPVEGEGEFELKNGRFNILSLRNAYSEGKRSEFFLEMNPPPSMDLDGNLKIYIKMKQFVLLKFTESFLISIEGKLDDPQFHLTKRRFFGLM